VYTPPDKGKQRIVHALFSLNDSTAKRQTTYEDLHMLKSVVRPQDWMLNLDVESVFFHVPIHPKDRKFFSNHLALPLLVKNKFIELQAGGYFVCSRPDLAPSVPSAQTPLHLCHLYHQVVEFSHATLTTAWVDELAQNLDERHVRSSSSSSPPRNAHAVVRRRLVDRLLFLRGSFKGATNNRGHAPHRGHSPRATQWLLRHSDPDPARPFGLHHLLHWQRSPTGVPERRCFALRRQVRALLFEADMNRWLVDSDLLRRFSGAAISCFPAVPLARFYLREVFNAQEQYKPRSFLSQAAVDNNLLF
jgi:hypothetical protein